MYSKIIGNKNEGVCFSKKYWHNNGDFSYKVLLGNKRELISEEYKIINNNIVR